MSCYKDSYKDNYINITESYTLQLYFTVRCLQYNNQEPTDCSHSTTNCWG